MASRFTCIFPRRRCSALGSTARRPGCIPGKLGCWYPPIRIWKRKCARRRNVSCKRLPWAMAFCEPPSRMRLRLSAVCCRVWDSRRLTSTNGSPRSCKRPFNSDSCCNIALTLIDQLSGLECLYALGTAIFRESRRWSVGDCAVAGLTARVALYIRQVCSGNCLKRVGRLGPCFDLRTILGYRHSTTHLRPWLQRRLLVSEQAIASLDQRSLDCSWRKTPISLTTQSSVQKPVGVKKSLGSVGELVPEGW